MEFYYLGMSFYGFIMWKFFEGGRKNYEGGSEQQSCGMKEKGKMYFQHQTSSSPIGDNINLRNSSLNLRNSSFKHILFLYRLFSGGILVMFGALASLEIVWNLGDLCMALQRLTAILIAAELIFCTPCFFLWFSLWVGSIEQRQRKRRGFLPCRTLGSLLPETKH